MNNGKIKMFAASALSALMLFAASCGSGGDDELIGKYNSVDLVFEESVTFKSGGKIPFTAFKTDMSGTYTIEDGEITYTVDVLGAEKTETHKFSHEGDSIFIDDVEYKKE